MRRKHTPGCPCCDGDCGTIAVTVRLCTDDSLVSGAVVTVKDADDVTVGSGTTDATGIVTVAITAAGTYTIVVAKTGQVTSTTTLEATCTANAVTIKLGGTLSFRINGCGCALPGATCTVTQTAGGSYTATGTTDATGSLVLWLPVASGATFSISMSAPLYVTTTVTLGPLTGSSCAFTRGNAFNPEVLATDPAYLCYGDDPPYCRDAIPATVTMTVASGPHTGTHTLTYGGVTTAGYFWRICLAGGAFGSLSTQYTYQASGQYFTGSSQGCNVPGGVLQRVDYTGAGCTGTPTINAFFKEAGTGACPIATSHASGTYTFSE